MINLKIYCENKNLYYEQFQSFCVLCVLCSVTKSCFPELWKNHEFLKYYNIIKPLKSIRRILKTFLKKETYFWKISVILGNLCTVQCGEILFPWTLEKSWVSKILQYYQTFEEYQEDFENVFEKRNLFLKNFSHFRQFVHCAVRRNLVSLNFGKVVSF